MNLPEAEAELEGLLTEQFDAALDGRTSLESPLITVPPSVGKSYKAAEFVNRYYREHGLKSLTIILSLKVDDQVEGRELWNKWKGHVHHNCDAYASKQAAFDKGYSPRVDCECGYRSQFVTDKPATAAIEYLESGIAESYNPIGNAIRRFDLRIVDEIDWSRLFDEHHIPGDFVSAAAESHPSALVRKVSSELHRIGTELEVGQTLAGSDLYSRIDVPLDQIKSLANEDPVFSVWHATAPNFPIAMAEIMGFEAAKIQRDESFNHRLWLNWTQDGYLLNMHWFKRPAFIEPTIVLDATASAGLVRRAFQIPDMPEPKKVELDIPEHVRTLQYIDKRVSKTDVEHDPEHYKDMLQGWVEAWPRDAEIGIITWKDFESTLLEWFTDWGFTNLAEPLHYWNLRSWNEFENVDYLVLFGCPTPNVHQNVAEARAFYFDDEPLPDFHEDWGSRPMTALARHGSFEVSVSAYKDPRLVDLHDQGCRLELLQAFHRCRPVRGTEDQTVLVVTSMPIPGVPVDQILGNRQTQVGAIVAELADRDSCKIADLVRRLLGPDFDESARTRTSNAISYHKKKLVELVTATAFPIAYDQRIGFHKVGEPVYITSRVSPKLGKLLSDSQRDSIPGELHSRRQWIFHRNKRPFGIDSFPISPTSDDSDKQFDLDLVLSILWAERFDGVGYVLDKADPHCVIDLDHCVDAETGEIDESARQTINELDSYTEFSPSGDGVHIWVKASLDGKTGNKRGDFEIYDRKRYMTVTGNPIPDSPTEINERQSEVDVIHERVFGTPEETETQSRPALNLDDHDVIERCQSYEDFSQLFDGDWSGHASQSEADFRLCCILAEVCGDHPEQIERIFRESNLMRPKWDTGSYTYGRRTVDSAIRAIYGEPKQ